MMVEQGDADGFVSGDALDLGYHRAMDLRLRLSDRV